MLEVVWKEICQLFFSNKCKCLFHVFIFPDFHKVHIIYQFRKSTFKSNQVAHTIVIFILKL